VDSVAQGVVLNRRSLNQSEQRKTRAAADEIIEMKSTVTDAELRPALAPAEPAAEIDFETDVVTVPVRLCNLPPLNAIASQVLALTTDSDLDLGRFSRVIEGDPAFAADILFLANSSLFGFPSRVHSLRHGIALLGLDRIKSLAVTVAMRGFLSARNSLVHQCWRHSAACALVCDEISGIFDVSSDRAYTAGILHDIGRLGLLKTYTKEMTEVLNGQYVVTQEVLRAEREALNVDHGRAGAWLVQNWTFPKDFAIVCKHHHDAPNANDPEILQLVKAACKIADAIGFPAVQCKQQPTYLEITSPLTPRMGRHARLSAEDLTAHVTERLAAFER
jgi:HD-like signal output (HDOD) protein